MNADGTFVYLPQDEGWNWKCLESGMWNINLCASGLKNDVTIIEQSQPEFQQIDWQLLERNGVIGSLHDNRLCLLLLPLKEIAIHLQRLSSATVASNFIIPFTFKLCSKTSFLALNFQSLAVFCFVFFFEHFWNGSSNVPWGNRGSESDSERE